MTPPSDLSSHLIIRTTGSFQSHPHIPKDDHVQATVHCSVFTNVVSLRLPNLNTKQPHSSRIFLWAMTSMRYTLWPQRQMWLFWWKKVAYMYYWTVTHTSDLRHFRSKTFPHYVFGAEVSQIFVLVPKCPLDTSAQVSRTVQHKVLSASVFKDIIGTIQMMFYLILS